MLLSPEARAIFEHGDVELVSGHVWCEASQWEAYIGLLCGIAALGGSGSHPSIYYD
jgi:hypothetical protein